MKRKLLSTILALLLIVGLFPTVARADSVTIIGLSYIDADTLQPIPEIAQAAEGEFGQFVIEKPDGTTFSPRNYHWKGDSFIFLYYDDAIDQNGKYTLKSYPIPTGYTVTEVYSIKDAGKDSDGVVEKNGFTTPFSSVDLCVVVRKTGVQSPLTSNPAKIYYQVNNDTAYLESKYTLDKYLSDASSTEYNAELAELAMAFSTSVYNEKLVKDSFSSHGFTRQTAKNYGVTFNYSNPAFILAEKTDANGNKFVAVILRGSSSTGDWLTDATIGSDNHHSGFSKAAKYILSELSSFCSDIKTNKNTTYFITGHSYGAAIANLLGQGMGDYFGISQNRIFTYTFATPNVTNKGMSSRNPDGKYDNIFNLCNRKDIVTAIPTAVTSQTFTWGKYGRTYWFSLDHPTEKGTFAPHDSLLYLNFMLQRKTPDITGNLGGYFSGATATKYIATGILCPVDVDVLNKNGVLVAQFINNQPKYLNGGENDLILYSIGDEKYIVTKENDRFSITLTATASGTMDYIVSEYDSDGNAERGIVYDDITLTKGQGYNGDIVGVIGTSPSGYNLTSSNGDVVSYSYISDGSQNNQSALDSASDWAREGIKSAIAKGFVPAELQSNYKNVITRAEFCRMAVKWVEYATGIGIDAVLAEKGVSRNSNAFTDTNDTDILAAYALGITNGTGNNKFDPNGQFTREQAATMIMNTCKAIGANVSNPADSGFADLKTASNWAVNGINFVRTNGIMQGTGNNNFSPKATYTREQSILTFDNIDPASLPKASASAPTQPTGQTVSVNANMIVSVGEGNMAPYYYDVDGHLVNGYIEYTGELAGYIENGKTVYVYYVYTGGYEKTAKIEYNGLVYWTAYNFLK